MESPIMTSLRYGLQGATVLAVSAISINHVSIHADDLERSVAFYEQLFGMERIPTPTFAFPVTWLRLGRQQLHVLRPQRQRQLAVRNAPGAGAQQARRHNDTAHVKPDLNLGAQDIDHYRGLKAVNVWMLAFPTLPGLDHWWFYPRWLVRAHLLPSS